MFSGMKVWFMTDAELRGSLENLIRTVVESFERPPTYEEFKQTIENAIERWFEDLEERGMDGVVYVPPHGKGDPIYVIDAGSFVRILVENALKDAYEDYFGRESSPSPGR